LRRGAAGFAVAAFASGEEVETEVPNLLIPPSAPPSGEPSPQLPERRVLKRPAAATGEYSMMYYKRDHCIGVRERFGAKRQVLSFGGASTKLPHAELVEVGEEVCRRLQEGVPIATAKAWAKSKCC